MKKQFVLFALFPILLFAQNEKNACETLSKINALIQELHYKPKAVDDSLSVDVYTAFLKELDEDNKLFTETEITTLKKHQYKIDDYNNIVKQVNLEIDSYNKYNTANLQEKNNIINTMNTTSENFISSNVPLD